jgi:hypothetical protein
MKRILTVLTFAALFILAACSGSSNGPINKDSLQGCYELDLSPILKDAMAAKGGEEDMGAAFAQMFLSKLEITVQFEADKAIVDVSGDAMDFIKGMAGSEVELPMTMEYKIENDSVLYLKQEGKDFEEVGVLKKLGDSYDYLKFISTKDDKRREVSLKKIK